MGADPGDGRGRFKRLARRFDRACRAVRIPFRHRFMYWFSYIRLARKGVLVHSPRRDAVYEDGPLKHRYDRYCEKINDRLGRLETRPEAVEVPAFRHAELELPDLHELMRLNIPFVLRGGAERLPAGNWTLDYIEQVAGPCEVPINGADDRPSGHLSLPTKAHHYYDFHTGTVTEVAESIRSGGNLRISTAENVMHHADGRLRKDLDLPYWEQVSGWAENQKHWLRSRMLAGKIVGAQLMLQPENAFTLWHAEPGDNFFVLARGLKTWTMVHPYYTAAMRPRVKTTTNYHGCNIDVRESDEVQLQRGFAGYLGVPKVRVTVESGDVLRVPNNWWHTVVTHPGTYTIAATIRANTLPNRLGPGYNILRWLDPQFSEIARSYAREGRIYDTHIGYPRKPRAAAEDSA